MKHCRRSSFLRVMSCHCVVPSVTMFPFGSSFSVLLLFGLQSPNQLAMPFVKISGGKVVVAGESIPVTRADPRNNSRGPSNFPRRSYQQPMVGGGMIPSHPSSMLPHSAAPMLPPYGSSSHNLTEVHSARAAVDPYGVYSMPSATAGSNAAPSLVNTMQSENFYALSNSMEGWGGGGTMKGGWAAGGGKSGEDQHRIYVGGVPEEVTIADVREHFQQ